MRDASGVEKCKQRVNAAKHEECRASRAVSKAEAFTLLGLALKAETIASDGVLDIFRKQETGILIEMTRFIDAALAVLGREPA